MIEIKAYTEADFNRLIELFKDTLYHINIKDYSLKELDAWSDIDLDKWRKTLKYNKTLIAYIDNEIVGFISFKDAYIDPILTYFILTKTTKIKVSQVYLYQWLKMNIKIAILKFMPQKVLRISF